MQLAKCFKTDDIYVPLPTSGKGRKPAYRKQGGRGEEWSNPCNTLFTNFIQRRFSVPIPAQTHCSKTTRTSVITKASSSGIILLSLIILLLKVQNITPVPLHHRWRDSHCWSLVLAAGDTGWLGSLALHNRDPNKGAKKPHIRASILGHKQCCNHKYQTSGNPNIRDFIHSKHRS